MSPTDPVANRTTRRLPGGITITRERGNPGATRLPVLLALIGLLAVGIHDLAYRQTGGKDFELYNLISHAGLDMLALTAALVITATIVQKGRR